MQRLRVEPLAAWLYGLCLRFYPPAHRRAFGPLMLQTFRDSCRDALATHGKLGMRFWLGVAGDEAKSLLREHGAALRNDARRMQHIKQWKFEIATAVLLLGSMVVYVAHCIA
jgi:hypothetical protein